MSGVLLWTLICEHTSVSQSAMTHIHQLCVDTRCSLEDLTEAVDDRNRWRESDNSAMSVVYKVLY